MINATLTNELRRIIRCLYEACEESGINVTQAIELYEKDLKEQQTENSVATNTQLSFEERAAVFVFKANLQDPTHDKVATEVLCFFHKVLKETATHPSQTDVIEYLVEEKIVLTKSHAKSLVLRACSALIFKNGGNRTYYEKLNWKQISDFFVLWAKSI